MPFHGITNGHFSMNGNFVSTDMKGDVIHILKSAMDIQKWKKIEDVQFPFYVAAILDTLPQLTGMPGETNRLPVLDREGKQKYFTRLTGTVIFKTLGSIIDAIIEQADLNYKLPMDHGRKILFEINEFSSKYP